jgi:hypothetical protein
MIVVAVKDAMKRLLCFVGAAAIAVAGLLLMGALTLWVLNHLVGTGVLTLSAEAVSAVNLFCGIMVGLIPFGLFALVLLRKPILKESRGQKQATPRLHKRCP